jgi:glutamate dehydrogenase/leucine dehydrogenase
MDSAVATNDKDILSSDNPEVRQFMKKLAERNPNELEFLQAVQEVAESIIPHLEKKPDYQKEKIFERMCEPERVVIFRVPWVDDNKEFHTNRGYRVQMNSAIGPYKGGLRFHPSVNLSILKFLAFEQIFKNSLTTLPLGAGKGGSDFSPKGKSDTEIMRFCKSFMDELHKHIGPDLDIPAGDIGVSSREIGYLYGQYKRLSNQFGGAITGKELSYGGSLIRPEATGYGCVYFAQEMLKRHDDSLENKECVISGAGNVAQYTAQKLNALGAKVLTLSDTGGYVYDKDGLDDEKINAVIKLKNDQQGRLEDFAEKYDLDFYPDEAPWQVPCDVAFPSATQNELGEYDAQDLIENGCYCICEGANMPCTPPAVEVIQENDVLYGPGKAANAGGVAVSGLEMTQNLTRLRWSRQKVDDKLKEIMTNIHSQCVEYGKTQDRNVDYIKGANIAGFEKVAHAMLAHGIV